jgi:hypothetical protein
VVIGDFAMTQTESRYTFTDHSHGFTITGKDRVTTTVLCKNNKFIVHKGEYNKDYFDSLYEHKGLFEVRNIISRCVSKLLSDVESKGKKLHHMPMWAMRVSQKALAKRISSRLNVLRQNCCDPLRVNIQRAYFAATAKYHDYCNHIELTRNEFLLKDILNYRAAAILIPAMIGPVYNGFSISHSCKWMNFYSCLESQELYTSLTKTLMNLPGGLPAGLVQKLRYYKLERPITDRLEFINFIVGHEKYFGGLGEGRLNIINYSARKKIEEAINLVRESREEKKGFRRCKDIIRSLMYIYDFNEQYNGDIVGLARRSIEYHQNMYNRRGGVSVDYDINLETAKPPIPLPEISGITFLAKIDDLVKESEKMHHCISNYAYQALNGVSYLFHAEHNGESASIEVDHGGNVTQAYGPCNKRNKACTWASNKLGEWGKKFPDIIKNAKFGFQPF